MPTLQYLLIMTRLAVSVLVLGLAVDVVRAQGSGGGSGTSNTLKNGAVPAMSPVEVSLESASIVDPMPFDVPFRFTGSVPAGATELMVEYVRTTELLTKRTRCERDSKGKPEPDRTTALTACNSAFATDTGRLVWIPAAQVWTSLGGPATQSTAFSITMPALDAEQYYRFRFTLSRTATPAQETAFREAVKPILDLLFTNFFPDARPRQLNPQELDRIWQETRSELRRAVGSGLAIKPTSIFSNEATWANVSGAFSQSILTSIIIPQTRRTASLENHTKVFPGVPPPLAFHTTQ
jgi:hypothetical protein